MKLTLFGHSGVGGGGGEGEKGMSQTALLARGVALSLGF
jgi:hypothetical protein